MSDDVFQIGYDAGYQAAREGEILFQLRHLEHPVQHQIITCYSQMGPLGFARGCQDREANERRVREQLGTDYRKER